MNLSQLSDYNLYREALNILIAELSALPLSNSRRNRIFDECNKRDDIILETAIIDSQRIYDEIYLIGRFENILHPVNKKIFSSSKIDLILLKYHAENNLKSNIHIIDKISEIGGIGDGQWFAVNVFGNSMIDANINDGDLLLCTKQKNAINKDIIIALVNGNNYIKRFVIKDSNVFLVSENDTIADRKIISKDDFSILGKVEKVIKNID